MGPRVLRAGALAPSLRNRRRLLGLLLLGALGTTGPSLADPGADPSPVARSLLTDRRVKVRVQAALARGQQRPLGAAVALRQALLTDPHPAVRVAAAASLGLLGDEEARPALQEAAAGPEPRVAQAARRALQLLDERAAAPPQPAPAASAEPTITGPGLRSSRTEAEVQQGLAAIEPQLRNCLLRQRKRDPSFTGVELRFKVLPDGRAAPGFSARPRLDEPRFVTCLQEALTALRLPPAAGGEQTIELPLGVNP